MAVVKMGQIKSTVAKALAYIARPDATSDGLWVSTNAAVIDPGDFKAIARQFSDTVERVGVSAPRAGSVLAHHVIQSFDPKDGMSAELAHRIGVQLAERLTGGSHEYMIATHLDKGHVHNHIILNAVNFESGRKFRVQKSTIGSIRDLSDELCVAAGLSVLPKPERATGRTLHDTYRVLKGESAKEFLRTEIDKAAARASSWVELEAILARAGIETSLRGGRAGTVSFREITMGRPVRDYRLGAAYTEESIMARMSKSVVNMIGVDASMIVKETRDTITVTVPGTGRDLQLTVAKTQLVRRDRSLRIYVPAAEKHLLSDRKGNLARTVDTAGLYQYFSQPNLVDAAKHAKAKQLDAGIVAGWGASLSELRALSDRINAKTRWMQSDGSDAVSAIDKASAHLTEQHHAYQTTLVAVTELLADPAADPKELRVLSAELRIIERDLDTVKNDIRVLTKLTPEEGKTSLVERITEGVDESRRRSSGRQGRGDDEVTRTAGGSDGRGEPTVGMSLQDRIAAKAEELKQARDRNQRGRFDGRGGR